MMTKTGKKPHPKRGLGLMNRSRKNRNASAIKTRQQWFFSFILKSRLLSFCESTASNSSLYFKPCLNEQRSAKKVSVFWVIVFSAGTKITTNNFNNFSMQVSKNAQNDVTRKTIGQKIAQIAPKHNAPSHNKIGSPKTIIITTAAI